MADVNSAIASCLGVPVRAVAAFYDIRRLGIPDPDAWFRAHPEVFAEARPLPGAAEALDAFRSAGIRLAYVTLRPLWSREITLRWLEVHGFPAAELVMGCPKPAAAGRLGASAFVEDSPAELSRLSRVCRVFAVGWPYNGSSYDWRRIKEEVLSLVP